MYNLFDWINISSSPNIQLTVTFCLFSMSSMFLMEEADPGLSLLGFLACSTTTSIFMAPFCVFSSLYSATSLSLSMTASL